VVLEQCVGFTQREVVQHCRCSPLRGVRRSRPSVCRLGSQAGAQFL